MIQGGGAWQRRAVEQKAGVAAVTEEGVNTTVDRFRAESTTESDQNREDGKIGEGKTVLAEI